MRVSFCLSPLTLVLDNHLSHLFLYPSKLQIQIKGQIWTLEYLKTMHARSYLNWELSSFADQIWQVLHVILFFQHCHSCMNLIHLYPKRLPSNYSFLQLVRFLVNWRRIKRIHLLYIQLSYHDHHVKIQVYWEHSIFLYFDANSFKLTEFHPYLKEYTKTLSEQILDFINFW